MKTGSKRILATLLILKGAVLATPLAAQGTVVAQQATTYTPHFFMAVLGGVILAIGFQILLTSLSVASGISLVGDLEEKGEQRREEKRRERQSRHDKFEADQEKFEKEKFVGAHNVNYEDNASPHEKATRAEARRDQTRRQQEEAEEEEDEATSTIVTISRAIGIWTVVTASISLFFASLLAVRLSMIGTVWMGITLGLIIWAAFFATMTYLEIRSVSTLIGGVFGAALDGLRASFSTAKAAFGATPEQRVLNTATDLAGNVREEVVSALEGFDSQKILDRVDEYVENLKPQSLDFDRIKEELGNILRDVRLVEHTEVKENSLDRESFIRMAQDQPHFKKEDVQKLSGIYDEVSKTLKEGGSGSQKAEALAGKLTGSGQEDVHEYRAKLETYLRDTGREELNPERIQQDIDRMFEDPKSSPEILMSRLKAMDRDTIIAVLSQRDDMTPEKADQIVSNVEKAVQFVQEKVLRMKGEAQQKGGEMQQKVAGMKGKAEDMQHQASGMIQSAVSSVAGMPARAEDRVRQYFASLNRPEFNYDRLRLDFERMIHHPKDSLKILRARMKMYDRDSMKALFLSREGTTEAEAEQMVTKFEEARDNAFRRAEQVENEIRERIESAKRMAWHEAENVRKASAVAAWWVVGTAVASGAFSALGAVIAITW